MGDNQTNDEEEPAQEEKAEESTEEATQEEKAEDSTEEPTQEEKAEDSTEEPSQEEKVEESTEEQAQEEKAEESTEEPAQEEKAEESTKEPAEKENTEESNEEPAEAEEATDIMENQEETDNADISAPEILTPDASSTESLSQKLATVLKNELNKLCQSEGLDMTQKKQLLMETMTAFELNNEDETLEIETPEKDLDIPMEEAADTTEQEP